jgi:hypothetical protein
VKRPRDGLLECAREIELFALPFSAAEILPSTFYRRPLIRSRPNLPDPCQLHEALHLDAN